MNCCILELVKTLCVFISLQLLYYLDLLIGREGFLQPSHWLASDVMSQEFAKEEIFMRGTGSLVLAERKAFENILVNFLLV